MREKYICLPIFVICYIVPIYFFRTIGMNIDNLLFIIYFLTIFISFYITKKKMALRDLLFIILVVAISIYQKSIVHMHLVSLVVLDKLVEDRENIQFYLEKKTKNIFFLCLLFIILYSCLYFGYVNRYLFTGIKEPNESSLLILVLFLFIRYSNKKMGNALLMLGFLTFSKSYMLGVVSFFIISFLFGKIRNEKLLLKLFSFYKLSIISIMLLIMLSFTFSNLAANNKLSSYASSGFERFTVLTDSSNYYRFTVNTNLLYIFKDEPKYILTGLTSDEFYKENLKVCRKYHVMYRKIRPHNYFFSYMQIYGIFSFFIFSYVNRIMKKIINKESLPIFLVLFTYVTFLGMGFNSYWLYLSVFLIIMYGGIKNGTKETNNCNKNI